MKKMMPKSGRSLFDMPVEDRPMIYQQREPFTAKRIAKEAGLAKGSKPVSKQKAPAKPKRSRRLNGLR